MTDTAENILVLTEPVDPKKLRRLVDRFFGDMVKYVVDVEQRRVALGGELHADGEQLLLESGSLQENLWGANYYPDLQTEECIEYTSLINIRPSQHNPSMEIQDPDIRETVREITFQLLGKGASGS